MKKEQIVECDAPANSTEHAAEILLEDERVELKFPTGSTVLDIINRIEGLNFDAPCGGKGRCAKCKVKVTGDIFPSEDAEKEHLTEDEMAQDIHFACMTTANGNVEIDLRNTFKSAKILTEHTGYKFTVDPNIRKSFLMLEAPKLGDQRDDLQRLADALNIEKPVISKKLLQKLPGLIRQDDFQITAVVSGRQIIALEPGDTTDQHYGIAVDIGTTTVVAYLLDLKSGEIVDVVSDLNHQKSLGADVISRINYTIQNDDGLEQLRQKIVNELSQMANELVRKSNIRKKNIYTMVIVGNTTMTHLLCGLDPTNIAAAPFVPVVTDSISFPAPTFDIKLKPECIVTVIPCVSGYVGADIVSGILATRIYEQEDLSLLIDIGTNGEIVLGNKDGMLCCATAAGPAFEGAHISRGVGGISGAINKVYLEGGEVKYTTIDDQRPIGICGSAIIDIVALLQETGVMDHTGRLLEDKKDAAFQIIQIEGLPAAVIAKDDETDSGFDICFTQKDIREVQLAKGAIAAGVNTLLLDTGKTQDDIKNVYIAGGFGSFLSKESALAIGLLPAGLGDRIKVVGNAAGLGAIMSTLSAKELEQCQNIKKTVQYVELSSSAAFMDEYLKCMNFPEK
ncbi:MAG: ASKHA domain-containing protein [Desulfobacterales bacterium]|nr:ASKHA domain-containing protein [Desulfobacterales bacterium]